MEDLLKVSFIYISELGRLLLFPDRVMRVEDRAANICTIFVSKKLADFLSESQNSRQPPPHGTLLFDPRSDELAETDAEDDNEDESSKT
ncbi:unnamed protein product [Acanthoscelides obtectus]|uniref:Uncharacterized protein n=1 Tax=Acanthoscelides obtectus TaxID=200917 RepID=A0A9P0KYH6_ACAOB|nr:unnamed protein product [Acanthoscelides obtectus]CAK1625575.1 hypothetical protein AOBTE_LOCUS3238 [Acanthoscelides obtectus]